MNSEAKLISAVCRNKDINTVLVGDAESLFITHGDIWHDIKDYYYKYRAVPDLEVVAERHPDFEPVQVNGETAFYLDEMKNEYINRELATILSEEGMKHGSIAGASLLERLQGRLSGLAKHTNIVRDLNLTDIEDAERYFERKAARAEEMGGSPGITTGIAALDTFYPTGLAPGHLIVVIGWSGRGKTWFSSYLAAQAWVNGYKPMIVSLEMSPEEMRERVYTILGSGLFSLRDFNRGAVNLDSFSGWAKERLSDRQDFIIVSNEGAGRVTPDTVQAKIDQHRPDLVICDYHQLFDDSNSGGGNEVVRNRNISRDFKLLAVNNGIPVIDLSQATQDNPSDTDEPPRIEQVAWSKGIQHDADLALAVHKYPDSDLMLVVSRKNRHGEDFEFALNWDIDKGIIKEEYGDTFD